MRAKKIQAGPAYARSIWSYRGIVMEGKPPRHGFGGASWSWYAAAFNLRASTRGELMALIDARLAGAPVLR